MNFLILILSLPFLVILCIQHSSGTLSYLSPLDKLRLKKVLEDGWKLNDVNNLHYAVASYAILKEDLPISEKAICDYLATVSEESDKLEDLYHIASVWKLLSSCKKPFTGKIIPALTSSNVEDKFYWGYVNEYATENSTKNILSHRASAGIDESYINVGFSLHLSTLPSITITDTRIEFNKIAKIVSRADEIDGQFLQYEGGLTATALVITGLYKVSEKLNETAPLTNTQVVKFTKYFLSRVTVSRPKGVYFLLEALNTLADNKFHLIASVGAIDTSINVNKSLITVRVSDLLGNSFVDKSFLTVEAVCKGKGGIKTQMTSAATSIDTEYTFRPKDLKLDVGFHSIEVLLSLSKNASVKKVIVNPVNTISFVISTSVAISSFQIGVTEPDRSSMASTFEIEYGKILDEELNLDALQRLVVKFSVKDINSGKSLRPHQAFVQFTNSDEKQSVTFAVIPDTNNYRLNVDIGPSAQQFQYLNGKYTVTLILADRSISSPIMWTAAVVNLRFPTPEYDIVNEDIASYYLPKPEIKHTFKEPEKRPLEIVSLTFTVLVLSPLLILFILWSKLGVNISNCPVTMSVIGFHTGLASIFILFGIFWLKLDMFETIKYLLAIGMITFLCGNKMLVYISSKRNKVSTIN